MRSWRGLAKFILLEAAALLVVGVPVLLALGYLFARMAQAFK